MAYYTNHPVVQKADFVPSEGTHVVPLPATVDFAMLKPLIRGALEILKLYLVAKWDKI